LNYIGCEQKRQKGSHIVFDYPNINRPVIVQANTTLPVFVIRNNLRTLKMPPQQYLDILNKI
jgi:predicted RNA binding protein YcfA (HicA-like mRNA interferase family)